MATPSLDQDLGIAQWGKDFLVEQFVPKLRVEALHVAILPRGVTCPMALVDL